MAKKKMAEEDFKKSIAEIEDSLRRVSEGELLRRRLTGRIDVVIKIEGTYYIFLTDKTTAKKRNEERQSVKYVLGEHLCNTCKMSKENICPKILACFKETLEREGIEGEDATIKSKRIEVFDFITKGVECFNSIGQGYFIVAGCSRYRRNNSVE